MIRSTIVWSTKRNLSGWARSKWAIACSTSRALFTHAFGDDSTAWYSPHRVPSRASISRCGTTVYSPA